MQFHNSEFDKILLGIKTREMKRLRKHLTNYLNISLGDITSDKTVEYVHQNEEKKHEIHRQDPS
jgi:hypothetical protein